VEAHDGALRVLGTLGLGSGSLRTGFDLSGRFGLQALGSTYEGDALTASEVSIDSADRAMAGIFAETEQPLPWARWSVAGGLRGDRVRAQNEGGYFGDHTVSHGAISGFAAVTFVPAGAWSTTLQVSRGFRDAMLSDRYFRGVSGRGFITGNPDLQPETTLQWDLAVRHETARWGIGLYGYRYVLHDLIERYRPAGSSDFAFRNAGTEELDGAELESEAVLPAGLVARLTLAWARGEIQEDGTPAPDVPAPSAGMALERRTGAWRGWVQWTVFLRDDRPRTLDQGGTEVVVPGYALLDASLGRTLGRNLEARLIGRNLLDKLYPGGSDEVDAPGPGRSATFALSGRW
jgi:outer membrane receptor protein involved in Fe transport